MGYNIEISFNILNKCSINDGKNYLINLAQDHLCNTYFVDFEMENSYHFKRNHCVITIHFENLQINNMIDFLKFIRKEKLYYIETICHDDSNYCIYASKHYLFHNVHKILAKDYIAQKKIINFSEQEKTILSALKK